MQLGWVGVELCGVLGWGSGQGGRGGGGNNSPLSPTYHPIYFKILAENIARIANAFQFHN